MDEAQSIKNAVKGLLGPGFAVACREPRLVDRHLFREERAYAAQAVAKRRAEFGTARVCAREALAELGIAPVPLVPRVDRSPTWPRGVTGSISHMPGWCVAAVTARPDVAGVGLDLEQDTPLEPDLEALVCTPGERRILGELGDGRRGPAAKLIFSAKEALYKCQYPATGLVLDFQDVELEVDFARGIFRLSSVTGDASLRQRLLRIEGRFLRTGALIATTALLPT